MLPSLREIGSGTFSDHEGLEQVLPDEGPEEPEPIIARDDKIKRIITPKSVTIIEDYAFSNCENLK